MSQNSISFRMVHGLRQSDWRLIGFLEGDNELNASTGFQNLKPNRRNFIRNSMDEWISGKTDIGTRFHGWASDDECWMCFAFKAREGRVGHRLYGFLHNPLRTNPAFRVCVLCIYAKKTARETDRAELLRVKRWSENPAAWQAIQDELKRESQRRGIEWKP